ncbi:hypothetical protein Y032_0022g656 [Ancylostoma ceylanicum]|uniref:Uncharacterized protein n=1 Tax=Ancylostoma ceylanicum TaxID=53326 RepID=A0A016V182_9BILA|nr:hypothetical protein Y032_0022g656 [Ancylostoma ceylanicum]
MQEGTSIHRSVSTIVKRSSFSSGENNTKNEVTRSLRRLSSLPADFCCSICMNIFTKERCPNLLSDLILNCFGLSKLFLIICFAMCYFTGPRNGGAGTQLPVPSATTNSPKWVANVKILAEINKRAEDAASKKKPIDKPSPRSSLAAVLHGGRVAPCSAVRFG